MLRKYNNVFITGDLHLGDVGFCHEGKLVQAIKERQPELIVFGGDTFDPWRGYSAEELMVKYSELFLFLKNLSSRVVFLRGNHDQDIDFLKKLGFSVARKFKYISGAGQRVKIMHGHEFDKDCQRFEFLTRKFVYLEEKVNRLLSVLKQDKIFRAINLLGNIDLARVIDNFQKQIRYYTKTDVLIFGHMHVPLIGKKKNIEFYNWGGWQNDLGLKPGFIVNRGDRIDFKQLC